MNQQTTADPVRAEGDFEWQTGRGSLKNALAVADRLAAKPGDGLTEAELAVRVIAGFYRREHELRGNQK